MLISLNLLRNYLEIDESSENLKEILTMLGHEVKEIIDYRKIFKKFVVGEIIKVDKHPYADKLNVCKVDIGDESLQIVCGATNYRCGDKVAVATLGTILPKGMVIKRSEIRGIESYGMLCSESELGLKGDSSGIFILNSDTEVGKELSLALFKNDIIFDLELTPNRGDCLSHLGIARELGAFYGKAINLASFASIELNDDMLEVINETEDCRSYYGKVVKNIKVKNSPFWMSQYLISLNIKNINNIVDASNFVTIMGGHPTHIFDLDKIKGKITIREAKNGEKLLTLDNRELTLSSADLVIADSEKVLALAGIIGGKESSISIDTKNIFIEVANFSCSKIRETSKRLAILTESSKRFEKGINPLDSEYILKYILSLIKESDISISKRTSIIKENYEIKSFNIDLKKANSILGVDISLEEATKILKNLDLYDNSEESIFTIKVPPYRFDIMREFDIYEELARMYGYDKIIPLAIKTDIKINKIDSIFNQVERIKTILSNLGLNEVINYSFVPKVRAFLEGRNLEIKNPLNEDFAVLRNSMIYSLFQNVKYNIDNGAGSVKVFEVSKILKLEKERLKIAIALAGKRTKDIFNNERDYNFFDLKEIVQKIAKMLGIYFEFTKGSLDGFHPYRIADILYNNEYIGILGEVHPEFVEDLGSKVFICEMDIEKLFEIIDPKELYKRVIKYPEVIRELSILFNKEIEARDIIKKAKLENSIVSDVEIIDIYEDNLIDKNMKSVSLKIKLCKENDTLEKLEINRVLDEILLILNRAYGAILRK